MPGQVDRDRVGHQLVQRDVVQAGAAGGQVRRRIHVRAGAVGERVLRPRVAVRRRVGKVAELRRRDARHDGHPVGHGVRQVDDLHLQRLSRRELATSRWKRLDRRIAHAEQARLACPAGQWPPRDTEVAETAAPAPRCASRPSPRTHGTAGAAAAYHKSPGSGWHDDELGGHMYATVAEPHEQGTDFNRQMRAHCDATIGELPLAACSTVPWWPEERRHPALHALLGHDPGNRPARRTRTSSGRWDGARSNDLNAKAPLQPRL